MRDLGSESPVLVDERDLSTEYDEEPVYRVAVKTGDIARCGGWGAHAWWEFRNTPLPDVIAWAYSVEERPCRVEVWLIRPEEDVITPAEEPKMGFLLHAATLE